MLPQRTQHLSQQSLERQVHGQENYFAAHSWFPQSAGNHDKRLPTTIGPQALHRGCALRKLDHWSKDIHFGLHVAGVTQSFFQFQSTHQGFPLNPLILYSSEFHIIRLLHKPAPVASLLDTRIQGQS